MAFQLEHAGMHYLMLLVLLAAAGFFYVVGVSGSLTAFLIVGGLFELGFWFKLFRGNKGNREDR